MNKKKGLLKVMIDLDAGRSLTETSDYLERLLIVYALDKCDGVKADAAKFLNTNRTTLVEKIKRFYPEKIRTKKKHK